MRGEGEREFRRIGNILGSEREVKRHGKVLLFQEVYTSALVTGSLEAIPRDHSN